MVELSVPPVCWEMIEDACVAVARDKFALTYDTASVSDKLRLTLKLAKAIKREKRKCRRQAWFYRWFPPYRWFFDRMWDYAWRNP